MRNHGVSPDVRHRALREKMQAMKAIWPGGNPHAEDKDGFPAFLERYEPLVERFGG